jgi:hypothetical protein
MFPSRILIILLLSFASLLTQNLSAQNFEVASVKRSAPGAGTDVIPPQQDPMRINYPGVALKSLLALAYGVTPEQITGPHCCPAKPLLCGINSFESVGYAG